MLSCPARPCYYRMRAIAKETAVSKGSHMQEDMDISEASRHLGAPIPLFQYCSRQKTTIQKNRR